MRRTFYKIIVDDETGWHCTDTDLRNNIVGWMLEHVKLSVQVVLMTQKEFNLKRDKERDSWGLGID